MANHLLSHQVFFSILTLLQLSTTQQGETTGTTTFTYTPQRYNGMKYTRSECPRNEEQLVTFLHEKNATSYMKIILNFINDDGSLTTAVASDQIQLIATSESSATYTPLTSTGVIPCPENEEQLHNILRKNFAGNTDRIVSILLNGGSDTTVTMSPESTSDQTQATMASTISLPADQTPSSTESSSTVQATTQSAVTTVSVNTAAELPETAPTSTACSVSTSRPPLSLSTTETYLGPYDFGATFNRTCNVVNGEALSQVGGSHDNDVEDRRLDLHCRQVAPGPLTNCIWSGFANALDFPLFFQCPPNFVMAGIYSVFDNVGFDRQFDLLCCDYAELCARNCRLSEYANDFDQGMEFTIPPGTAIIGAYSFHRNFYEDRRWRFSLCDYTYCM